MASFTIIRGGQHIDQPEPNRYSGQDDYRYLLREKIKARHRADRDKAILRERAKNGQ
ncbi:hypothetical protein [Fibrisoma montanum]|uniref:hypothetical protein n=1 Tax=Fibrisoma montanum TaxID=2305895 RepID=UPI0013140ABE|nr:hypothetical protein [Fibrisoma montanum]